MNQVWEKYSENNLSKPNVYFPKHQSFDGFNNKLVKYGLGNLQQSNPSLYNILLHSQPIGADTNG